MKKLQILFLIAGIAVLASCTKPSEKAAGNYNGTYTVGSNNYTGTANVIASGDNVNMTLTAPTLSLSGVANGVVATASGDNVSLAYSSASTTDGDVTAISGTLTGNNLAFSFTYIVFSIAVSGTFSGSK